MKLTVSSDCFFRNHKSCCGTENGQGSPYCFCECHDSERLAPVFGGPIAPERKDRFATHASEIFYQRKYSLMILEFVQKSGGSVLYRTLHSRFYRMGSEVFHDCVRKLSSNGGPLRIEIKLNNTSHRPRRFVVLAEG